MKKSRLYIFILLVFLMYIIVIVSPYFKRDIRSVALYNNGVEVLNEYRVGESKLILLPKNWDYEEIKGENNTEFNIIFDDNNNIKGHAIIEEYSTLGALRNSIVADKNVINEYWYEESDQILSVVEWKDSGDMITTCYYKRYSEGKALIVTFERREHNSKSSIYVLFEEIVLGIK